MGKNNIAGKILGLGAVAGAGAFIYKKYDTIKSMYHRVALFKGERYVYEDFDNEAVAALFSGIEIDLKDAELLEDELFMDVYALCSAVRIIVPENVEVVIEGDNYASHITVAQDEEMQRPKKRATLFINYYAAASSIHVSDLYEDESDDFEPDDDTDKFADFEELDD